MAELNDGVGTVDTDAQLATFVNAKNKPKANDIKTKGLEPVQNLFKVLRYKFNIWTTKEMIIDIQAT